MSSSKKAAKNQKIEQEGDEATKPEKRQKTKKKKKQQQSSSQQIGEKQEVNRAKQSRGVSAIREQRQQQQQNNNRTRQQSAIVPTPDRTTQQLSQLQYDGLLTPSPRLCLLISTLLQRLTINLLQKMLIRPSLLTKAITTARQSLLTPKEYFCLDYTNKLLLIRRLMRENSGNKYEKWVVMVDGEVERVERMVVRSLEEVKVFEEVLVDLKKNNVEWDVKREKGVEEGRG